MTVDVTELVAEYGAFYINQGQNMNSLVRMLRQKPVTAAYARPAVTDNTVFRQGESSLGEVVQAFQKAFTSKATLKFTPRPIELFRLKIDHAMYPDEIVESWVGFFENLSSNERKSWPLIRYLLEMEVIPQMQADLESKCAYKGVYSAPTPNVAGLAKNSMNGIRKWLSDGIADNSINNLNAIGTVTENNIFDKVEEMVDTLSDVLEGEPIMLAMSPYWKRKYLRDKRNTHGSDVNYNENKLTVDFYDNVEIVGLPSMSGTKDIFITPKRNFRHIRRSGMKTPKVEELKREVFLMTDWWEGYGFDINELIYAYLPASSGSGS